MEYGKNILPADAAMYTLQNADIQAGILRMSAGGYLKYKFSEADIVTLSEYIRVALVAEPFTDRYAPKVRIHIHLESEEGGFYNSSLYPTEFTSGVYLQELQMKAGKYNKFTFEVFAKEPITFTMLELCPEAADEDIQTIIEGVEQSLPRLLYDYNMWPLTVEQDEKTIALVTYRLLDHTDLQGHFQMTYVASEACTLTLRFKDNGATELFSPLLYDLHAGRGSVGVPHAYLERLAGIHSVIVTAQVNTGTLAIDTRGILFTIDGGYLAERMLDVGVDMRDISIRQLSQDYGPDEIWIVGIEAGEVIVRKRKYDPKATISFTPCFSVGQAVEAAIEFDGDWVLRPNDDIYTLETQENPWIFWIDSEMVLYGQLGDDETTKIQLDTDVSKMYVCRGYKSIEFPEQDQGLVVAYIKDGTVYYIQYAYNSISKEVSWGSSFKLDDNLHNVVSVAIQRLNDYCLCFSVVLDTETRLYITGRTYVAQAIPKETIYLSEESIDMSTTCIYPANYDTSINLIDTYLSDDRLHLAITIDRELRHWLYDFTEVVSFNDSIIYSWDEEINMVDKIEMLVDTKLHTTTIHVYLNKPPKKLITAMYWNFNKSSLVQAKMDNYGWLPCPRIDVQWDTTIYSTITVKPESVILVQSDSNDIYYTTKGNIISEPMEEIELIQPAPNFEYTKIQFKNYIPAENVNLIDPIPGIEYKLISDKPI